MRTLRFLKDIEKRSKIANETLEIFAPLAERIGVNEIKEELEQLRALDNGKKIVALKSKRDSYLGIDTSLDLDLARSRIMHDKD